MDIKYIIKLTIAAFLLQVSALHALPYGAVGMTQPPMQIISTSDIHVQQAAKFAEQQLQVGTLSRILSAKIQGIGDVNYFMRLEFVDANGATQVYQVEVCIPQANIPWKVKSAQRM